MRKPLFLEDWEEKQIHKKFGHRARTPEEEWITVPEGMSTIEWIKQKCALNANKSLTPPMEHKRNENK